MPGRIFAKPVSSKDISEAMQRLFQKKQRDNKYCASLWEEWMSHHQAEATGSMMPPHLKNIETEELQHWIWYKRLERRMAVCFHQTLFTIIMCCGIMGYIRANGMPEIKANGMPEIDFFKMRGFKTKNSSKKGWIINIKKSCGRKAFRWQHSSIFVGFHAIHEWTLLCSTWWKRT